MTPACNAAEPRRLFMVLSPRALGYGKYALKSLFEHGLETVHLHLITDSHGDKDLLTEEMVKNQQPGRHAWSVFAKQELDDRADAVFANYPNLRLFRDGHPCWRKITDPILLSGRQEEIIVLDPDLYFPNRFCFEPTPDRGLLLMWQKPNCLVPCSVVKQAFAEQIPLAHHVDIGVAHWRAPADLDWLEWLLLKLHANRPETRHIPHIEAIVWAALAVRVGGGYLPAELWHCRYRSQSERVLRRLGFPGHRMLHCGRWVEMKCFHAGGEAKFWMAEAIERGSIRLPKTLNLPGPMLPFEELTLALYNREQRLKRMLGRAGYYRIFAPEWASASDAGV